MKTFKQFLKGTKIPIIPVPIHFKHVKRLKNVIPSIPEPIDFRYVNLPKKTKKKIVREDVERRPKTSSGTHDHWIDTNDNAHLSDKDPSTAKHDISEKLYAGAQHLNKDHRLAIGRFTSNSQPLNHHLLHYRDHPFDTKVLQHTHQHLSDTIDKHPLQHDVHVYSGAKFDPRHHLNKDGHMHSPAYISATHDKRMAYGFAGPAAEHLTNPDREERDAIHIIHFHLKKGDPAYHPHELSNFPDEHETIIKHGATLKHNGTKMYKSHKNHIPMYVHHMEIVHDKK